jgi:hypothetical protein
VLARAAPPALIGAALALLVAAAGCGPGGDAANESADTERTADGSGLSLRAPGRVLLIGIDGATPRIVYPMIDEGLLPNLARFREQGVAGRIRSLRPIDSPRIWNTIATGKSPDKHGIKHFAREDGEGQKRLYLSIDRKVHSLWNIASDAGLSVSVVNFWNTYPPELIDGVMVSDHLLARNIEGRRRLTRSGDVPVGPVIHPPEWRERLADLLDHHEAVTSFRNPLRDNPDLPPYLALVGDDLPRRFDEDGLLVRIARAIDEEIQPDLSMILLPGIDRVSHFLWSSLEDPAIYDEELRLPPEQQAAGKAALWTYYRYTDALIGQLMEGYAETDLVIVLSDHGFEAGRGMGLLTGIHESEAAMNGVFFARGAGIAAGAKTGALSVRDVTPTILAWLELPIGEDMDGEVASFVSHEGVTTVATHDDSPIERMALQPSGAEDEIVEQLRNLGYIE